MPGMFEKPPASYEEFWPYYVSQHMDPTCRKLHFVGTSLALANLAISPVFPPAFLAAPVYGYGLAWIGHFAFEKNRPATWMGKKEALWSLRSDFRMYRKMLKGEMDAEVARVRRMIEDQQAIERAEADAPHTTVTA